MSKERLTFITLSLYLILAGFFSLFPAASPFTAVLQILALAAGILILITFPGIASNIGWQLAGTFFVLRGLELFGIIRFQGIGMLLSLLALISGILFLIRIGSIKTHVGFFLFSVWLVLVGVVGLFELGRISLAVAVLSIASGVLMILDV